MVGRFAEQANVIELDLGKDFAMSCFAFRVCKCPSSANKSSEKQCNGKSNFSESFTESTLSTDAASKELARNVAR